ncbi:DUF6879 family protein [Streptomyces sp. PsTaAH-130]|uniref:DUF6879 family protein n=1 Tax=unclassified Streptomyces TaxID=2593676 RepID=UPI0021ACBC83|nr:DUF6879 family protein [Streptomyces sp. PsTaAH-130]
MTLDPPVNEPLANHGPKEVTRVPHLIDLEEFGRLFETFEHSAWHLETRRGYASDREDPSYAAFIATGTATWDTDNAWCTNIRRQTSLGKYVGRVRVVDDPPTTGQLFLLDYAKCNAATGEDVRNLWRAEAMRARLPGEDFWIFDSRLVAVLDFDDDGTLLGIEVITEPAQVLRYCQVRDAAMHHAIAYDEFAAQVARTDEPAVRPPSPAGPLLTVDVAAVPPRTAPPPRPPAPPPPT